ncbi:MAG: porin, partial [bacterium]
AQASDDTTDRLQSLENQVKQLSEQLNATADAVEAVDSSSATHIGGYGELHYNNLSSASGDKKTLDFHRFVLFVNHEFSPRTRFFSELELEHAFSGDGAPGEVELEQAYVEFDLNDRTQAVGGVFLIPVGFINETHEPPTFYGVERNPVEKNIIPATWWEAGAGIRGNLGSNGISYHASLTSGLNIDPATISIRSGRQKAAKAKADNLAIAGGVKYTGIQGLELAASVFYQDDVSQDSSDQLGSATLLETHAAWNRGPVAIKALYARWDIDGNAASSAGKDVQDGGYLEAAYRITPKVGVFARSNQWSNEEGVDKTQQDLGINYWPHEDVVIKADIQQQNADAGDADGFNVGIGYQF